MIKIWKQIPVVMALALTAAAPIMAQAPAPSAPQAPAAGGQQRGGGRRGVSPASIPIEVLEHVLTLKADQKTKIVDIQTRLKDDAKAATGDRQKMMELNQKATMDIEAVLTDEQKTKLKEIVPMLGLLQQSRAIPVAKLVELKLTDDQKKKIKDAVKEAQDKMKDVPRGDRTARQAVLADLKTKVDGLLTEEQKKTLAKTEKKASDQ